jgi:hypothetical protein
MDLGSGIRPRPRSRALPSRGPSMCLPFGRGRDGPAQHGRIGPIARASPSDPGLRRSHLGSQSTRSAEPSLGGRGGEAPRSRPDRPHPRRRLGGRETATHGPGESGGDRVDEVPRGPEYGRELPTHAPRSTARGRGGSDVVARASEGADQGAAPPERCHGTGRQRDPVMPRDRLPTAGMGDRGHSPWRRVACRTRRKRRDSLCRGVADGDGGSPRDPVLGRERQGALRVRSGRAP